MPRYIIKLEDKYMEWSTVVDAPITYLLTYEQLTEYIKDEYGSQGLNNLSDRMKRVEEHGSSSPYHTTNQIIKHNRAGKNETHLSKKELIKQYQYK
jgi:hypothetical protein